MDIQLLVSILGPALWEVFKTLLEKGRDIALDKGSQPLKDWVDKGYDGRKDAETLYAALSKTLDQLTAEGQHDALVATWKFTGLDKKAQFALAGAAVDALRAGNDFRRVVESPEYERITTRHVGALCFPIA
jgi:hypothetical protein